MRLLLLTVLAAGTATPIAAQWIAPTDSAVRQVVDGRVAAGGSTGMVVAVLDQGQVRFVATAPHDRRTLFEIGSISKVFTTTLLAQMVVTGEVKLEDPAQQYLPAGVTMPSKDGRQITLLDLATATSGLPRMPAIAPANPANPYADYGAKQLYQFLTGYTLTRAPGESYEYSNLGMGLLGHLLSLKAGIPYEQLVTQRILLPLGMRETWVTVPAAQRSRVAPGHNRDLDPAGNWDFDVLAGAGGWRSTPEDMARFLGAVRNPPATPLGQAIKLATESRRPTGIPDVTIGLGWHVIARNGQQIIFHNGETGGYHSYLGFSPGTGANALVLGSSADDIDDIALNLIDPTFPRRVPRPTVPVPEASLAEYVGTYELAPTFSIVVTHEGDRLYLRATNQPRFRLFAASQVRWFVKVVPAEIGFVRDTTGKVSGLVLYQNGQEVPGKKVR